MLEKGLKDNRKVGYRSRGACTSEEASLQIMAVDETHKLDCTEELYLLEKNFIPILWTVEEYKSKSHIARN